VRGAGHDEPLLGVGPQGLGYGGADHVQDLVEAGGGCLGQRRQGKGQVGQAQAGQLGVEAPAERGQVLGVHVAGQGEGPLFDAAGLGDDDQDDAPGAGRDQLDVPQGDPLERGVLDDGRLLGDLRQRPDGSGDHVVEVDGARQHPFDGPALGGGEGFDRVEGVDEMPVPLVGRDAAGRRVGLMDEARFLEGGHVVADRGGRDAEVVAFDQASGADGLARRDVVAHDGFENPGPAVLGPHGSSSRPSPVHSRRAYSTRLARVPILR